MLLTNAILVNWNPREITPDRALLIRDGVIVEIGATRDMLDKHPAEEQRDCKGRYLLPGNICAHTHFYGAYARGLAIPGPAPRDFPQILERLWWPLDKALMLESIYHSARVSLVDAIKHGTTTLFDHHASPNALEYSLDVIADAVSEAGLRGVLCYEVTDRDGPEKAAAGIAENIRFRESVQKRAAGRFGAIFGLHASLTLGNETLRQCADSASGFHIHVAEHEADEEDANAKYGVPVVTRLNEYGILNRNSIVAHAIHIDPWEMQILKLTETWVAHQPRSNMNNGVGAMRFDAMLRGGVKVVLGNDGFSNDMWSEWKAAYLSHKLARRDPRSAVGDAVALVGADHNATLASQLLGITVGTLVPGAAADCILIDYHPFTPLTEGNLPWHVLFGFESSMCVATICDGKVLMWDRVLQTMDEAQVMQDALAHAPEVWARYREAANRALKL